MTLLPVEEDDTKYVESEDLIEQVIWNNKESSLLDALQVQAVRDNKDNFSLKDDLLLYNDCLLVSSTLLRTVLITECHNQASTAHPSIDKTY